MARKEPEEITGEGKDREKIKKELLGHLEALEHERRWKFLRLANHLQIEHFKWPSQLIPIAGSPFYKTMKGWLKGLDPPPFNTEYCGAVNYTCGKDEHGKPKEWDGLQSGDVDSPLVKSVLFSMWFIDDDMRLCVVSYGEHTFNNEVAESLWGGARYAIIYKKINPATLLTLFRAISEKTSAGCGQK